MDVISFVVSVAHSIGVDGTKIPEEISIIKFISDVVCEIPAHSALY
jgi:hypothetical protein